MVGNKVSFGVIKVFSQVWDAKVSQVQVSFSIVSHAQMSVNLSLYNSGSQNFST